MDFNVITEPCIFNYLNCWEPKVIVSGRPKYSVQLIIPKSDAVTVANINNAIRCAYEENALKLKGSDASVPAQDDIHTPLRDGDKEHPNNAAYKGSWFLNASSYNAPRILDTDCKPITDRSAMYSGVKGRASLCFYAYNVNGNRGIGCALNGLQKISDGGPLDGRSRSEDDFTPYKGNEDFLN